MLTTVAWKLGSETTYAIEGSAFIAGAAVQWLRDGLGLIGSAPEIEAMAASVEDSGGVIFVPALAVHFNPTSERLAHWLYTIAVSAIEDQRVTVAYGRVFETLRPVESVAEYRP